MDRFSKVIRGFDSGEINLQLFTDGSCFPNPCSNGEAGYAYLIKFNNGEPNIVFSGRSGEATSTNNRMELKAVIEGLKYLKEPTALELITDSEYVGRGITSWMSGWKKLGWRQPNADLWKEIDYLCARHTVYVTCIRGHQGQPENEICDQMAERARLSIIQKNEVEKSS